MLIFQYAPTLFIFHTIVVWIAFDPLVPRSQPVAKPIDATEKLIFLLASVQIGVADHYTQQPPAKAGGWNTD